MSSKDIKIEKNTFMKRLINNADVVQDKLDFLGKQILYLKKKTDCKKQSKSDVLLEDKQHGTKNLMHQFYKTDEVMQLRDRVISDIDDFTKSLIARRQRLKKLNFSTCESNQDTTKDLKCDSFAFESFSKDELNSFSSSSDPTLRTPFVEKHVSKSTECKLVEDEILKQQLIQQKNDINLTNEKKKNENKTDLEFESEVKKCNQEKYEQQIKECMKKLEQCKKKEDDKNITNNLENLSGLKSLEGLWKLSLEKLDKKIEADSLISKIKGLSNDNLKSPLSQIEKTLKSNIISSETKLVSLNNFTDSTKQSKDKEEKENRKITSSSSKQNEELNSSQNTVCTKSTKPDIDFLIRVTNEYQNKIKFYFSKKDKLDLYTQTPSRKETNTSFKKQFPSKNQKHPLQKGIDQQSLISKNKRQMSGCPKYSSCCCKFHSNDIKNDQQICQDPNTIPYEPPLGQIYDPKEKEASGCELLLSDLHPLGKFIKITNQCRKKNKDLDNFYLIQTYEDEDKDKEVSLYKFPLWVHLPPGQSLKVWSSCFNPEMAKLPRDLVAFDITRWATSSHIVTKLCNENLQTVSYILGCSMGSCYNIQRMKYKNLTTSC